MLLPLHYRPAHQVHDLLPLFDKRIVYLYLLEARFPCVHNCGVDKRAQGVIIGGDEPSYKEY